MGRDKKNSKGRLDKYYHMAKEQGYRARSAFKLIQLNKKYNFLEKAKCLVDLCAAPGGWLQVAQKYMPKPSVIIGIDLCPIKPIPNVITFTEDITTEKCRARLRSELKNWKADVFLHDGAPNVGTSWLQDAFTQSELTLSSLKLATQFLAPNGTFVTKVFRSKDYNKLMWVFNQLFKVVEATKPASSRNVSAEIFVVCRQFLAPKTIDPRLLDAKWVFKELDEDYVDEKKQKERSSVILNDLMHPEKRKRHRSGYEEGNYTLFQSVSVKEFIESHDHVVLLSKANQFEFDEYKDHPLTTPEVIECCQDLKLLGKKDFKLLLKWREQIRLAVGLDVPKQPQQEQQQQEKEADVEDLMLRESRLALNQEKREKRRKLERKAKTLLKLKMGMQTPMEIGVEAGEAGIQDYDEDFLFSEESDNSDDDRADALERQMDRMYQEYTNRKLNTVEKVEKSKKEYEDWYGIKDDQLLSNKATTFFSNPVFDSIQSSLNSTDTKEDASSTSESELEQVPLVESDQESEEEIEQVQQDSESDAGSDFAIKTAAQYTLAQKLLSKSGKRDLVDDSFNRYTFHDPEGLPSWFMDDENRHNKPQQPVTKEAINIMKERFKALDARPIKKIAEAKYRKQLRAMRRFEKMKTKAEAIAEDEDLNGAQKVKDIQKLLAKAKKKQLEKKPALVVAKGPRKGLKGRPKGVKGRYKMVDPRMKKELKAQKRKKQK